MLLHLPRRDGLQACRGGDVTARAKAGSGAGPTPATAWERLLQPLANKPAAEPSGVPLGLQFEAVTERGASTGVAASSEQTRLRLRPVIPGKSGKWARAGVSSTDLRHEHHYPPYASDHRLMLRELFAASRPAR